MQDYDKPKYNEIPVFNSIEERESFYLVYTRTYKTLSIILMFLSTLFCLFTWNEFNNLLSFYSPVTVTIFKILLVIPIILGALIYYIARNSNRNYRAIYILVLTNVFSLVVIAFQVIASQNLFILLISRAFFLLAFMYFMPAVIYKHVYNNIVSKIIFWGIIVCSILLLFSDKDGTAIFFSIHLVFTYKLLYFFIYSITVLLYFLMLAIMNVKARLQSLLDINYNLFFIFLAILPAVFNAIIFDLYIILAIDNYIILFTLYFIFLCNYFIFLCSFVELFLKLHQNSYVSFAKPVQAPNVDMGNLYNHASYAIWNDAQCDTDDEEVSETSDSNENE